MPPPLKPCLKRPVNMYQTRKKASTPSAFQPFSTIAEDLVWDPYNSQPTSTYPVSTSWSTNHHLNRPTNFRSEISRFTESLYNLAKPTPIKPRGQFPRVERYPTNITNMLNPSLPMKPVQNLDQINPFTGLPNIEFIPTTEYLGSGLGTTSSYLPDATPSPDTTSRRVAAILEPTETYSDLVHHFNKKKVDQHNLQVLETQMASLNLQPQPLQQLSYNLPTTLYQTLPTSSYSMSALNKYQPANLFHTQPTSTFLQRQPSSTYLQQQPASTYLQQHPATLQQNLDPTFLGRQYLSRQSNQQSYGRTSLPYGAYSGHVPTVQPASSVASMQNLTQMNSSLQFDQQQLNQAWMQLSNELQQQRHPAHSANSLHQNNQVYQPQQQPLQGVLDMMSIDRINNLTKPQIIDPDRTLTKSHSNISIYRNNLTSTPVPHVSPINTRKLEKVNSKENRNPFLADSHFDYFFFIWTASLFF